MFASISRPAGTAQRSARGLLIALCVLLGLVAASIWRDLTLLQTQHVVVAAEATDDEPWPTPTPVSAPQADASEVPVAALAPTASAPVAVALGACATVKDNAVFGLAAGAGVGIGVAPTPPAERTRAAALLQEARTALDAQALGAAAAEDASCREAQRLGLQDTAQFCAAALSHSEAALLQPGADAIERLARLAASTRDPLVYALAYQGCNATGLTFHSPQASCQLLSAEQWARLDPDNAVPWLQLAAQAGTGRADEAVDNALRRAAHATHSEAYGVDPAQGLSGLAYLEGVTQQCGSAALADARRAELCGDVAHMLVSHSQAPAELMAGAQLGERLGWPAQRTNSLVRELLDGAARCSSPGG